MLRFVEEGVDSGVDCRFGVVGVGTSHIVTTPHTASERWRQSLFGYPAAAAHHCSSRLWRGMYRYTYINQPNPRSYGEIDDELCKQYPDKEASAARTT